MNDDVNLICEIPQGHSYSPRYLINLYKKIDDITEFFNTKNKNKQIEVELEWIKKTYFYKQIIEAYHASFMCLAMNKYHNIKYNLILADAPDIIMINEDNCMPFEIYEAFEFWKEDERSIVNMEEQIAKLYQIKWQKNYSEGTRLLIINRIPSARNWFNVSKYTEEINKYKWWFCEIRLWTFNESDDLHSFFNVFPVNSQDKITKIDYSISKDKKFFY